MKKEEKGVKKEKGVEKKKKQNDAKGKKKEEKLGDHITVKTDEDIL